LAILVNEASESEDGLRHKNIPIHSPLPSLAARRAAPALSPSFGTVSCVVSFRRIEWSLQFGISGFAVGDRE
jgi:hypothetical protein